MRIKSLARLAASRFLTQKPDREPPAPGLLPVLTAEVLLRRPDAAALANRIIQLTGLGQSHLDMLVQPVLERYARFVQELPASEAHHHAGRGGMLIHGLEVAAGALSLRQGHLLPHGAEPEAQSHAQHVWTYAVFTAALLHDIGKPVVDQRVVTYDDHGRPAGRWDPLNGPITDAGWYQVAFVRNRRYGFHERVAPLLASRILPPAGLAWLGRDPDALSTWLAALNGDHDGAGLVGEIIRQADGESVARNLGAGGARERLSATTIPLHEKLLTALRHLIHHGVLPLNRDGAAGWRVDNDLWLVSKRVVDALREHLHAEGHEGIPTRNDRLFDVLQEHGLVHRTSAGKAVWRCRVAGDGWSHDLTLLRMRPTLVWPDPDRMPEAFAGRVTPLEDPAEDAGSGESAPPSDAGSDAPAGPVMNPPGAQAPVCAHGAQPAPASPVHTLENKAQSAAREASTTCIGSRQAPDAGQCFLSWLQEGLRTGSLCCNEATARIHVVPGGVLLVSPGIFRDFAAANSGFEWQTAQKRFQKLKLHQKTAKGTNIHRYQVTGERKHSRIHGLLITDATILFGDRGVPQINPHVIPVKEPE